MQSGNSIHSYLLQSNFHLAETNFSLLSTFYDFPLNLAKFMSWPDNKKILSAKTPMRYIYLTVSENSEMPLIFFSMAQTMGAEDLYVELGIISSRRRSWRCGVIMQVFCGHWDFQRHPARKREELFYIYIMHNWVKPWVRRQLKLLTNNKISSKSTIELENISNESRFVLENMTLLE